MGFATALMAIVTAAEFGASLYSGKKQEKETEKSNTLAYETYQQEREDRLDLQREQTQRARESLSLSKRSQKFAEEQAELNREERDEDRGYNRFQNAANRYSQYLNQKAALTSSRLSPMFSRGR